MPRHICALIIMVLALTLCAAGQCAGQLYPFYGLSGCVLMDAQGQVCSDAYDSIMAVTSPGGLRRFIARFTSDGGQSALLLDEQGQPLMDRYCDDIYVQSGTLIARRGELLGTLTWQGDAVLPTRYTILVPTGSGACLTSTDDPADGLADEMYITLEDGSSRYLNLSAVYISAFSDGLVCARSRGGGYGYLSQLGVWAIAPIYDAADDFAGGKAVVWRGGLAGLIDHRGNAILPTRYNSIAALSNGAPAELTVAVRSGMATVYDADMLPVYTCADVEYAYLPEPDMAVLVHGDGMTLCNAQGQPVLELGTDEFIETIGSERALITGSDGVLLMLPGGTISLEGIEQAYALREGNVPYAICAYDGAHWGALNLDGQALLPCQYDSISEFCEGVFAVTMGARIGLVNSCGEWLYSESGGD